MNMTPVITIEKLKIYDSYDGDIDGFARGGKKWERALFGDDIRGDAWGLIFNAYTNLDMIGRGISDDAFTRKILEELEQNCDAESFGKITYSRDFYKQFQSVGNLLVVIKGKIDKDSSTAWTHYTSPQEILDELDTYIENIRYCSFETLEEVRLNFLPTATYQELSISNGWPDLYLRLAEDFDKAYMAIKKSAAINPESPINYELYTSFAEATVALINVARELTWNDFSTEYVYILSEIKDKEKTGAAGRKETIAENKKKKPVPLEELLPVLEKMYDNVNDFHLYVFKTSKKATVIDIRFHPKLALDPEYRKTVQDAPPDMHAGVPLPPWRKENEKFDIHWEHWVDWPWWRKVWRKK